MGGRTLHHHIDKCQGWTEHLEKKTFSRFKCALFSENFVLKTSPLSKTVFIQFSSLPLQTGRLSYASFRLLFVSPVFSAAILLLFVALSPLLEFPFTNENYFNKTDFLKPDFYLLLFDLQRLYNTLVKTSHYS